MLHLIERYHFRALLALLLGIIFLQPISQNLAAGPELMTLLTGLVFVGALYGTRQHFQHVRLAIGIAGLWVILTLVFEMERQTALAVVTVSVLLAGLVAWASFSALFLERKADLDALAGAIFGFFLLALIFGQLFRALEIVSPGSFSLTGDSDPGGELIYLSIVTITTLGYGDVLPISPTARMLSGVEAAFGTLYIAILIGRIVGALKPARPDARSDD